MPRAPFPQDAGRRWAALLHGPRLALPGAVDAAAERWAGLPPRLRVAACCLVLVALVGGAEWRVRAAQSHWGGPPVEVLVASRDLGVGEVPDGLRQVLVPPSVVPPEAARRADAGAALALPLPEGAVLTRWHLDARGPGAGLAPGLRAVPVTVEDGWAVTPGGWVDVWVLDQLGSAELVARSRPVLDVRGEAPATALVGLAEAEVEAATRGLSRGALLLTHAPGPSPAATPEASPPEGTPPAVSPPAASPPAASPEAARAAPEGRPPAAASLAG